MKKELNSNFMDHSNPNFIAYMRNRKPGNGIFLSVWETLSKIGDLEGLDGDQVVERVAEVTEKVIEEAKRQVPS